MLISQRWEGIEVFSCMHMSCLLAWLQGRCVAYQTKVLVRGRVAPKRTRGTQCVTAIWASKETMWGEIKPNQISESENFSETLQGNLSKEKTGEINFVNMFVFDSPFCSLKTGCGEGVEEVSLIDFNTRATIV